jgi:outer membrane protein OmpA-like peptidoglycan-associated protein
MAMSMADISEAGVGLLSLFGGFLKVIAPPGRAIIKWTGLASMTAGLAFLAVKLLARMSTDHASLKFWGVVAFASLVLSMVLWLLYFSSLQARTADYAGQSLIIGTEYEPAAKEYHDKHPTYTAEQMLDDYGGKIGVVWTKPSLERSILILGVEYSLSVACLAFTLNLGLEVLNNAAWTSSPPERPTLQKLAATLKDVHFELDRSDLQQDARDKLSEDAGVLADITKQFPKATVIVGGHCDDRGSLKRNLALGYDRARAVGDMLAHAGVSTDKLRFASYGNGLPLCTEATEECMRKNRRVHFTVVE